MDQSHLVSQAPSLLPEPRPLAGPGWTMRCRVRKKTLQFRLLNQSKRMILQAKLLHYSHDPEALPALLQVLARYSGRRLATVIAAADALVPCFECVFIEQTSLMASTPWVELEYDIAAWGLSPRPRLRAATTAQELLPEEDF